MKGLVCALGISRRHRPFTGMPSFCSKSAIASFVFVPIVRLADVIAALLGPNGYRGSFRRERPRAL